MNFNSKAILTTLMILVCGFCADGHAKSKKSKKHKQYDTPVYVEPAQKVEQAPVQNQEPAKEVVVITPPAKIETPAAPAIVEEKIAPEVVVVEQEVVVEPEVIAEPVVADSHSEVEELHEHVAEHAEVNDDAEQAS